MMMKTYFNTQDSVPYHVKESVVPKEGCVESAILEDSRGEEK